MINIINDDIFCPQFTEYWSSVELLHDPEFKTILTL